MEDIKTDFRDLTCILNSDNQMYWIDKTKTLDILSKILEIKADSLEFVDLRIEYDKYFKGETMTDMYLLEKLLDSNNFPKTKLKEVFNYLSYYNPKISNNDRITQLVEYVGGDFHTDLVGKTYDEFISFLKN